MKIYYPCKIVLLLLCLLATTVADAQQKFMVGSATVGIDPDSSVFSVPLAGYGAPRNGRFSIQWELKNDIGDIKPAYLTAAGNKLYAVNTSGELISGTAAGQKLIWKKGGVNNSIKALTASSTKLYAVTADGDLLTQDIAKNKGWQKTGKADNISAITVLNGKLYAATTDNNLLQGTITANKLTWKNIGIADNITLLTSDGEKIYAVDAKNTMYSFKPGVSKVWLKIGINNSSTYTTTIKQLLVYKKRLYILSADDKLLVANHTTDHTLSARSMAIKSKGKTVVIVTLDLTGFDYSFGKQIKDEIYRKHKIPASAIIINASHTHFAPVSQWFPTFGEHGQIPDTNYFNKILKRGIIRSIEKALDNMTPSTLYFGRGTTNIGHNRSSADNETPYDQTVDVLKVQNAAKKISNVLFITGCHPVFRNEGKEGVAISANYPGVSRKMLEEKTGAGNALFVQGCAGDINPRDEDHRKTGTDLGNDVLKILAGDMTPIDGDISYTLDSLLVPTNPWSKEKIINLKEDALKLPGDVQAEKDVRWANLMMGYYEHNNVPKTMPEYIQTITIGKWKLVGLSREVVTEYGPAIRAIWPDKYVTVAGYCNEVPSYLPVARHINAGTYEGVGSFFWNAQPSLFPVDIFDRVIDKIKTIKN
jgi:hypothetical protein